MSLFVRADVPLRVLRARYSYGVERPTARGLVARTVKRCRALIDDLCACRSVREQSKISAARIDEYRRSAAQEEVVGECRCGVVGKQLRKASIAVDAEVVLNVFFGAGALQIGVTGAGIQIVKCVIQKRGLVGVP